MELSFNKPLSKKLDTHEQRVNEVEKNSLIIELEKIKKDLQEAYNNFNYVEDALLVDYYTYQIKAYEAKHEYLLKRVKEIGIIQGL